MLVGKIIRVDGRYWKVRWISPNYEGTYTRDDLSKFTIKGNGIYNQTERVKVSKTIRKPKPIPDSFGIETYGKYTLARVHEDFYSEQFAESGDGLVRRDVVILEDLYLFDGDVSYKRQAIEAERLGKWLLKYAEWIKTRKLKEGPNR